MDAQTPPRYMHTRATFHYDDKAAFHRWLGLLHLLARDPQGHLLSGFSLQILIHSYRLEVTVWFKRFPTISNDGEAVLD